MIAPAGPVYQAGTLSGNPLAMAAGLATLRELRPEVYEDWSGRRPAWRRASAETPRRRGFHIRSTGGSMITLFSPASRSPIMTAPGPRTPNGLPAISA